MKQEVSLPVEFHVGEQILVSCFEGVAGDAADVRIVAAAVFVALMCLSGVPGADGAFVSFGIFFEFSFDKGECSEALELNLL